MAFQTDWAVAIGGTEVTEKWRGANALISISVSDKAGQVGDRCTLTLDDAGGRLRLPAGGEKLTVRLDGVTVFAGTIDTPKSSGSRSAGRMLSIGAKGFDTAGRVKQVQAFHLDDASLGDFLGRAANSAGLDLVIDPTLAAVGRSYWSAEHESFLALGQRLADQLEATFKIRGDKAVFARRGQGLTPGGASLPAVAGVFGKNLISWDITPRDPRRSFASGSARWFDRQSADFKKANLTFGLDGSADNGVRSVLADEMEAEATLDARKRQGAREGGQGTVVLDLAPGARVEADFKLSGARTGVDGTYRIDSVEHRADRSGGATTTLGLKQPAGGAGSDTR